MTKEAKIGLVSIISLALLYFGINYLKGINLFKPVNHYFVTFHNVKDVTVSSPVYIDGFKVGLVRSIVYDYENTDKITVEISLDDENHKETDAETEKANEGPLKRMWNVLVQMWKAIISIFKNR